MKSMMKLTGFAAIDYAEQEGLALNQSPHTDPRAHSLSIDEAEAIAMEHPHRVWLLVPETQGDRSVPLIVGAVDPGLATDRGFR